MADAILRPNNLVGRPVRASDCDDFICISGFYAIFAITAVIFGFGYAALMRTFALAQAQAAPWVRRRSCG